MVLRGKEAPVVGTVHEDHEFIGSSEEWSDFLEILGKPADALGRHRLLDHPQFTELFAKRIGLVGQFNSVIYGVYDSHGCQVYGKEIDKILRRAWRM